MRESRRGWISSIIRRRIKIVLVPNRSISFFISRFCVVAVWVITIIIIISDIISNAGNAIIGYVPSVRFRQWILKPCSHLLSKTTISSITHLKLHQKHNPFLNTGFVCLFRASN